MSESGPFETYAEFATALDALPDDVSPLQWAASLKDRPAATTEWLIRWVREQEAWESLSEGPGSNG